MRAVKSVSEHLGYNDPDDMLVNIGTGKESAQHVANRLLKILVDKATRRPRRWAPGCGRHVHGQAAAHAHQREAPKKHEAHSSNGVVVKGIDDVLVRLSRCCNPVRATRSSGSSRAAVACRCYRADCPNAQDLMTEPERIIEVSWENEPSKSTSYQIEVFVEALEPHEPAARRGRDVVRGGCERAVVVPPRRIATAWPRCAFCSRFRTSSTSNLILSKLRGIEACSTRAACSPARAARRRNREGTPHGLQAKGTCVSVEYLVLGMLENNVYLISDGESTLVVDPSCKADAILEALDGRKVDAIVLTAPAFRPCGRGACPAREDGRTRHRLRRRRPVISGDEELPRDDRPFETCPFDLTVKDGDKVQVGGMEWKVIATPGHTKGGHLPVTSTRNAPGTRPPLPCSCRATRCSAARSAAPISSAAAWTTCAAPEAPGPAARRYESSFPATTPSPTIGAERGRVFKLYA